MINKYYNNKSNSGFTIIELIVVVIIIAVLAAVSYVSYGNVKEKAYDNSVLSDLETLDALETSYILRSGDGALSYYSGTSSENDLGFTVSEGNVVDVVVTGDEYCIRGYNTRGGKDSISNSYIRESTEGVCAGLAPSEVAVEDSPAVPTSFVVAWGGTGTDVGRFSLVQADDDGYVVIGQTDSSGAGLADAFIAKYNYDGTLAWNKTWGGANNDYGYSLTKTADGGYAMTGQTYSYTAGLGDMFLAKFAANGILSWSRTLGGTTDYEYGYSLDQTSDGGYIVTGKLATWGAGNGDMYISKYTSAGALSWTKMWGGSSADVGYYVIETSDGGYAVTGQTSSFGTGGDLFLAKYASDGTLTWNKTWGGTGVEVGRTITQTGDDEYILTGYTASYGGGGNDMVVLKFSSSGTLLWNKTWGGTGGEIGYGTVLTSDGDLIVTGQTSSYGAGNGDTFMAKYTSDGNLLWNKTWGGTGIEAIMATMITRDNGLVMAGSTASYGAGGTDMLLIKCLTDGVINGCSSPMCQDVSATETTPSVTVGTPTATITTPSPTTSSPTITLGTPLATQTTIVPFQ